MISLKTNMAIDEGNGQRDKIGVAVKSLLWVRVELVAW